MSQRQLFLNLEQRSEPALFFEFFTTESSTRSSALRRRFFHCPHREEPNEFRIPSTVTQHPQSRSTHPKAIANTKNSRFAGVLFAFSIQSGFETALAHRLR